MATFAERAPLVDKLLHWDISTQQDLPPNFPLPDPLSATFTDPQSYISNLEPLFLLECWAQVAAATFNREAFATKLEVARVQEVGPWRTLNGTRSGSMYPINEGDLVSVRQDGICTLAIVEENVPVPVLGEKTRFLVTLRYRASSNIAPHMDSTLKKVLNTVSIWREYCAINAIHKNPLSSEILTGLVSKPTIPLPVDVQSAMGALQLNEPQATAILSNLSTRGISLIQGPPGTGKTTTILALIAGLLRQVRLGTRTPRILVCAPSNAAVDEIATRLLAGVRDEDGTVVHPTVRRIGSAVSISTATKHVFMRTLLREKFRGRKRITPYERLQARLEILRGADVVCTTLSSAGQLHSTLAQLQFKTVIVDEACQATETSTLIPLTLGCERAILIGDPLQLPPTVISKAAAALSFGRSLFVRIMEQNPDAVPLLSVQYRMHPHISAFPSSTFYDNRLLDGPGLASKRELSFNAHESFPAYSFVHVVGGTEVRSNKSLTNPLEAIAAADLYEELQTRFPISNSFNYSVGIITPYKAQFTLLCDVFTARFGKEVLDVVRINTADGFQGQEKDVIIFSCVRGGPDNINLGFLTDKRRMNVALTRAKSALIILGDSDALSNDETWGKLVQDARTRGCLKKVTPRCIAPQDQEVEATLGAVGESFRQLAI